MSVRAVHSKAGQRRSRSPKASLAVLVRAAPPLASRSLQWRFGLKPQLLLRRGPPLRCGAISPRPLRERSSRLRLGGCCSLSSSTRWSSPPGRGCSSKTTGQAVLVGFEVGDEPPSVAAYRARMGWGFNLFLMWARGPNNLAPRRSAAERVGLGRSQDRNSSSRCP